jgi:hypothetical protein
MSIFKAVFHRTSNKAPLKAIWRCHLGRKMELNYPLESFYRFSPLHPRNFEELSRFIFEFQFFLAATTSLSKDLIASLIQKHLAEINPTIYVQWHR